MSLLEDYLSDTHLRVLRPKGGCHTCPRKKLNFVPPTLRQTDIIFVGEAPGETEVKEQEGFVGASGQKLRQILARYGINDYSLTNAIHCRPPNNKTPTPVEVECCLSQFVLNEVKNYPYVVLVGNVPLQQFFPGARANKFRGNVAHHPDFPGQRFYAIYHPSYILRRPDMESVFERQIARLARLVKGQAELDYKVIKHPDTKYWETLQSILSQPLISLDIETNRLESWFVGAHIRALSVSADGHICIYARDSDPHWVATLEAVKNYLEKPYKRVVGTNIGFDLEFLESELEFRVLAETIYDIPAIWYQAGQYQMPSLKELAATELDGYRHLIHNPHRKTDPQVDAKYSSEDVIFPLQLLKTGLTKIQSKTRDLALNVVSPANYILRRMTATGIYFRQDYWEEKKREYAQKEKDTLELWMKDDPQFIPTFHNVGNGLIKYLYELKGLPIVHTTESGQPSTDDTTIKKLIREHDADYLKHLLMLKKIDKFRSTYLDGYEKWIGPDGRIHSQFTTTFTDSGRTSSRGPNLQNIPRDKEIRDLFGAFGNGVLLESDFSQIEFRIMVCLARDETGIEGYRLGTDAHTMTARSFTKGGEEPTKQQRSWAKVINFSLLYGGDEFKVQQWARDQYGLDWTIKQARRFKDNFFNTYKRLPEFHAICNQQLIDNRGWFESVTGHVFYYRDYDHPDLGKRDHAFRAHINAQAQGPAAQICLLTMRYLNKLLLERELNDVKFVNHVHDSVILEIPDRSVTKQVILAVEDAKKEAYQWVKDWFVVPLIMEHEVGRSWGSLKQVDVTAL